MRTIWALAAAVGVTATAGTAHAAQSSWYARTEAGFGFAGEAAAKISSVGQGAAPRLIEAEDDVDADYQVAGAVGARVSPRVRMEGEVIRTGVEVDSGDDIGDFGVAANAYYDVDPLFDRYAPYVGGGLGLADSNFLWQLKAGVGVSFSRRLTVDVGYRYMRGQGDGATFSAPGIQVGSDIEWDVHAVTAGVRLKIA